MRTGMVAWCGTRRGDVLDGRCVVWHSYFTEVLPKCTVKLFRGHTRSRAQIRRAEATILRHVPPRSALRLLSVQASSPQQHSSPSAFSDSFATSCVPSSRLGTR